jgi:uncharacterized protein YkwD
MISLTMEPPSSGSLSSRIKTYTLAASFLILSILAFSQDAPGQNIQPRPVARLVSNPVGDVARSRSRRVTTSEEHAVTTDAGSSASPSIDEATEIERRAFEKTNQLRVEQGMAPLAWDADLCRMARAHSENMARQGYFSHESLDGLHLKERARATGIPRFRVIGENIAYNKGYEDPGGFAVGRWMISPGHRANILYIGFQASAIGSYVSTDGSVYITQVFIAR